jgi:hypothetical protein
MGWAAREYWHVRKVLQQRGPADYSVQSVQDICKSHQVAHASDFISG